MSGTVSINTAEEQIPGTVLTDISYKGKEKGGKKSVAQQACSCWSIAKFKGNNIQYRDHWQTNSRTAPTWRLGEISHYPSGTVSPHALGHSSCTIGLSMSVQCRDLLWGLGISNCSHFGLALCSSRGQGQPAGSWGALGALLERISPCSFPQQASCWSARRSAPLGSPRHH